MSKRNGMSERGRQRVMQAAGQVEPATARDAAILGGIVRCAIDTGHFSESYIRHYTPQALGWFANCHAQISRETVTGEIDGLTVAPLTPADFVEPTSDEVAVMLKRFIHFYNPPELVAA